MNNSAGRDTLISTRSRRTRRLICPANLFITLTHTCVTKIPILLKQEPRITLAKAQPKEVMAERGLKGAKHIIDNGWSKESINKRRKSRLLGTVKRIQDHYHQPYTEDLRVQARKDKVAFVDKVALSKYITAEDIHQLSYAAQ